MPKVPCKLWFYMVPTDKAIMEELCCSVCIILQTSQGKSKDLESLTQGANLANLIKCNTDTEGREILFLYDLPMVNGRKD